jgi:hypothetical protein
LIPKVRDSKLACPLCKNHLRTDNKHLWCENADCDFAGLFGELVFEGKLVNGKLPEKPKKRGSWKKEQGRQPASRSPHKAETVGSIPTPATSSTGIKTKAQQKAIQEELL